jgi:hypothetical protein
MAVYCNSDVTPLDPAARFKAANVRRNTWEELKARRGCNFCTHWSCHKDDYTGVCAALGASTGPRVLCDEFDKK